MYIRVTGIILTPMFLEGEHAIHNWHILS